MSIHSLLDQYAPVCQICHTRHIWNIKSWMNVIMVNYDITAVCHCTIYRKNSWKHVHFVHVIMLKLDVIYIMLVNMFDQIIISAFDKIRFRYYLYFDVLSVGFRILLNWDICTTLNFQCCYLCHACLSLQSSTLPHFDQVVVFNHFSLISIYVRPQNCNSDSLINTLSECK